MITENGKIARTFMGREDHGIPTCTIQIGFGSSTQAFGMYDLRAWPWEKMVGRILEMAGADSWETLPGKFLRVRRDNQKIHAIGHIIEDKWFCPDEEKP